MSMDEPLESGGLGVVRPVSTECARSKDEAAGLEPREPSDGVPMGAPPPLDADPELAPPAAPWPARPSPGFEPEAPLRLPAIQASASEPPFRPPAVQLPLDSLRTVTLTPARASLVACTRAAAAVSASAEVRSPTISWAWRISPARPVTTSFTSPRFGSLMRASIAGPPDVW